MFTGIPYNEMSRDVTTQILCVLIGQECLSRPMICLKGLAQAKIIKKSVILFRVLNMTI